MSTKSEINACNTILPYNDKYYLSFCICMKIASFYNGIAVILRRNSCMILPDHIVFV